MTKDGLSFSAESKGILRIHFTPNGLSVDAIQCEWIMQDGQFAVGQFTDGMIIFLDKSENGLSMEFYQDLDDFISNGEYPESVVLEVWHRLGIRRWKGVDVALWFQRPVAV